MVEEEDVPRIAPSRGTHLVLDAGDLPMGEAACIVPAGEGRMIFALPWYGRTLIGTTDNDFEGDTRHPRPAEGEVESLKPLDMILVSHGHSDHVGEQFLVAE